ncbi:MAG TPA: response regulator [Gemmataceae bacterium]|nr:response regulator [Gemmataceae bacterium]
MSLGLLLCDDLLFASRITGEARGLGLTVKSTHSLEQLLDLARQEPPSCVLIDLAFPGLVLPELFRHLGELCNPPRVVAYGSHVDVESLRAARAAGCDPVLPRSKFVEELPRALPQWIAGTRN